MSEYLQVWSKEHPEISGEIWVDKVDGILVAQSYLVGPGYGDLLVQLVQEEIQQYATAQGLPVLHEMIPSNSAAIKLAKRTDGYTHTSNTQTNLPIFTKTIFPAK